MIFFLLVQGARVWIKDPSSVWKSANVLQDYESNGKQLLLETDDLEKVTLDIKSEEDLPHLRNPDILIGENDLTSMSYLHEPAVLHNLAVR